VLEENVFTNCEFNGFSFEGGHIYGAFIDCKFVNLDWYWGLFNNCLFIDKTFVNCKFRGTSFSDSKFVDCTFESCQFLADNLNASCRAEEVRLYGTAFIDCVESEIFAR